MVAVIKTGHSIQRILNYNENKVKEGVAKCISSANYPKDTEKLSFSNKLNRLLHQAALNTNVSRNSVHVSLNFDPSENNNKEKLEAIANTYMERIGFGNQPYLVYQHFDAGHPHIHIVSIKVREDGSRIDTQNIGRNQSEKARREIEKEFGLIKADSHKRTNQYSIKPLNAEKKIQYGKSETKRGITNVLNEVLMSYKYTSIPELNAVLKQFNVMADRGSENSRTYKSNGLMYRLLDDKGKKIGVPIKASGFYNKPTLKFLEERFLLNDKERLLHKARVKNAIDTLFLQKKNVNLQTLMSALEKEGIHTIVRQNNESVIYGITYVDNKIKCVFNGSDLGKAYSAKGLLERCIASISVDKKGEKKLAGEGKNIEAKQIVQNDFEKDKTITDANLLEQLMQPKEGFDYVPWQLKKSKRKKRKGISR
jgi:hypothetical protein